MNSKDTFRMIRDDQTHGNSCFHNRREFIRLAFEGIAGACSYIVGAKMAYGKSSMVSDLWVVPRESLPPAEQVFAVTLQGLINRQHPHIWMQSESAYQVIQNQLEREGAHIHQVKNIRELYGIFHGGIKGAILCRINTQSLNVATSLCGPLHAVALDESLLSTAQDMNIKILADVRTWTEQDVFNRYRNRLAHGVLVQQTPEGPRIGCVRDFAVAHNAYTYFTKDPQLCTKMARAFGPNAFEYGSGALSSGMGEYEWFSALSRANASGVASDWSQNLSALERLPAGPLNRPKRPDMDSEDGVRYVAFVMTDGDNIQWLCGGFVGDKRFWDSPLRGQFPMTWGFSPMLAVVAPRVLKYLYSTAKETEGFVTGPGVPGCSFLHLQPDSRSLARQSEPILRKADLPIVSVINTNEGHMSETNPLLDLPYAEGVLYQDYTPYNRHAGKVYWHGGKPCISYKFMLWEGNGTGDMTPEELAKGVAEMSTKPFADETSYALVAVHAWSWGDMGGPLEAVRRTIAMLPPNTRVVTADQMLRLMKHNLRGNRKND